MKIRIARLLAVTGVLAMLLPSAAFAAPPTPLPVVTTWDADMINVEAVGQTGAGVYVAVLDTGLAPNWKDYFPKERVATRLGAGFYQPISFKAQKDECAFGVEVGKLVRTSWVGSRGTTHGTHVASTILGYNYRSNHDALSGFPLPPIFVNGIAPDVTIIPIKVLADYQIPALPKCNLDEHPELPPNYPTYAHLETFGTGEMVARGIVYATNLARAGYRPMVINMSLGSPEELSPIEKEAIDDAIAEGVIVVAAAGNEGAAGMSYPGAYEPVISAGSSGWTKEWLWTSPPAPSVMPLYRMWWLQSDMLPYHDIDEPTPVEEVYVSDFSSRELDGQQLDVLAPGSWVRGPYPGFPGYSHLPWWSKGIGDVAGWNPGNFYYVGGTSMSSPHVAGVAALMLQKDPSLTQSEVEAFMKLTALPIAPGSADVYDISPEAGWYTYSWEADATGAGLIQADAAVGAVPAP